MPRIQPVNRAEASAETQKLLSGVESNLGMLPNMIATMAQSGATVRAYLGFSQSLASGVLPRQLKELIAITVAQANGCEYCLAAHSAVGKSLGITDCQLNDARASASTDRKIEAVLRFAHRIVEKRGGVSDEDLTHIRAAGYDDGEIAEIVAHVAFNTLTNYFNKSAQTEIDFPPLVEVVCD